MIFKFILIEYGHMEYGFLGPFGSKLLLRTPNSFAILLKITEMDSTDNGTTISVSKINNVCSPYASVRDRFWDVATGLGGEDGEDHTGEGGFLYTKIFSFYLKGGLQYQPPNMCPQNKQTYVTKTHTRKCYI